MAASWSNSTPGTPARIALDTSCVVNLLNPHEVADADLLRLVRLGTEGRTRLMVTPLVDEEIPTEENGSSQSSRGDDGRRFIRQRLNMFAEDQISPERRTERDVLGEKFHKLLWPNAQSGSRTWNHSRRDCLHLASLKLCGGGVFVTLDGELWRKAGEHAGVLGCEVLRPGDLVARIPVRSRNADRLDAVVRKARADDAAAVTEVMRPIKASYPNFDDWWARSVNHKEAYVGVFEGKVAGVAVWSPKDERVVKLSTFYVGDDYQGRGLGPHLLFHQLRLWIKDHFEKVFVTVSSERLHVLEFFLGYGFRIEGASARRYRDATTEFILGKHLYYEQVGDEELDSFLARISGELFSLSRAAEVQDARNWFMPPRQRALRPIRNDTGEVTGVGLHEGGERVGALRLNEFEELVYPARLALAGRQAFMIPIKPRWADALMEVPRQQTSLFANTDKLRLRTDNAYYCSPRMGPSQLSNSPALFYVSHPDKGIAGFARILGCRLAPPEELFVEFGDIGVYTLDDIKEHVRSGGGAYSGKAMALRFAWWVPFRRLVSLDALRSEFGLEHPQTVTSVPYETYVRILRAGGIDW